MILQRGAAFYDRKIFTNSVLSDKILKNESIFRTAKFNGLARRAVQGPSEGHVRQLRVPGFSTYLKRVCE